MIGSMRELTSSYSYCERRRLGRPGATYGVRCSHIPIHTKRYQSMSDIKWATARIEARLMIWDAIMITSDVADRRLLVRVYIHMGQKGWVYAK